MIRRRLRHAAPDSGWALFAMPFILLFIVGLLRLMSGPGYGLLPLLAVGPASAAAVGGRLFTLCVGGTAAVLNGLIAFDVEANTPTRAVVVSFSAIAGVTVFALLASHIRLRRVPIWHQDGSDQLRHPQPLQLGPRGPQFLGLADSNPPLGVGLSEVTERHSFTVPLRPGEPVLFYTDGLSEARNRAGEFFPLAEVASVRAPADPSSILRRLSVEVSRYVGHRPHDVVALLLVERTAP
jgi:hypothetical protein